MTHINKHMSNIGKSLCYAITVALLLCAHAWAVSCGEGGRGGICPNGKVCSNQSFGPMTSYRCVEKTCAKNVSAPCADKTKQCINTALPGSSAINYICAQPCGGTTNGVCGGGGRCVKGSDNTYSCAAANTCNGKQNGTCSNNQTCTNTAYMNQPNPSPSHMCGPVCGGAVNGLCTNGDACKLGSNNTYSCQTPCGDNYRNGYCGTGKKCISTTNVNVPGVGIRAIFECKAQ